MQPKVTRRVISTQRRDNQSPPMTQRSEKALSHTQISEKALKNAKKQEINQNKLEDENATMIYFCIPSSLRPKVRNFYITNI